MIVWFTVNLSMKESGEDLCDASPLRENAREKNEGGVFCLQFLGANMEKLISVRLKNVREMEFSLSILLLVEIDAMNSRIDLMWHRMYDSCRKIGNLWLRTEYDRGVNTFSPEGRLFQVEYAIEAIKLGSTAIGLKTKEGVVLAVEKRITSPLLEPSSVEKIMEIDEHIGCAMSGLIADARTLVEHARVETQNHRFSYGEPMTVESTTQALCDLALRFGEGDEESMSRPFGVSLLIAGHDENGPSLYYTDPSGTFWQCNGKAIGSGSEGADSSLQEQYNKDLTLLEAETIALSILKQVMEEKVTPNNVDIAKVAPTYHLYTPSEVEAVISRL
ncbi:unnamed protein product [Sphenostylis stenocarpa]|uniref:Proteasome alpha-type subunits domain-containing protein n=1 Tax=Sphenostylis stenocarpa TaxID=92480 RepID=A0AA86W3W9_9FABA|nr:unnamed protein product [Sphenostylis stenocarpa]